MRLWGKLLFLAALALPLPPAPDDRGVELFEKKIRPVLAENCYACHNTRTVATAGLALDSVERILKGGNRGAVIVRGVPEASRLIQAISYRDPRLSMPPTGKLDGAVIDDFVRWIKMGAPFPAEQASGWDSQSAQQWWSLQPFRQHPAPEVRNQQWPSSLIDYFVLAKLEESGLAPAPPADKLTLLRRATFDLIGLPPTPSEIEEFLKDDSPYAFEKVVERLLASEHYGERWARHWLDLVRFAETNGHEFDQEKPDAWRYRDYVIRAFNQDLPYNRFIKEQIAGDLLTTRRLAPDGTHWDSLVATGFWGLGEERNAADDLAEVRADKVDNQIDVLGKTFLGLTLGCARCHDHKFDPVTTADYYALAGVMHSTRIIQGGIDSPARLREIEAIKRGMAEVDQQIQSLLCEPLVERAKQAGKYLLEAAEVLRSESANAGESESIAENTDKDKLAAIGEELRPWVEELRVAAKEPDDVLYPFAVLSKKEDTPFDERLANVRSELLEWVKKAEPTHPYHVERGDVISEDFSNDYSRWTIGGAAFGTAPSAARPTNQAFGGHVTAGLANSFSAGSDAFTGTLTSKSFRIEKEYMHVRLAGTKDTTHGRQPGKYRVAVWSDGRFGHLTADGSGRLTWQTEKLSKQDGQIGFLQIVDRGREGHIAVDQIVLSDSEHPPEISGPPSRRVIQLLEKKAGSLEELARNYQEEFVAATVWQQGAPEASRFAGVLYLGAKPEALAAKLSTERREELDGLRARRRALESSIPDSAFGMLCIEDQPQDVAVHIRGDYNNLGEVVPRRFLAVLEGKEKPFRRGSGRLELAEAIADAGNPLTARVMVNRIWKNHFGEGLVRTPDNFGINGEYPSHPELLDTLAALFVKRGWSVNDLHRLIVLSSTYRMSSKPQATASTIDAENRLLHHFPVRRLEAEAIRDAILAVTGTLNRTTYGPSVLPHISNYQDGRGKPPSGPLDGDGRRSIYIGVRRNFLTPLLTAFDYPLSVTTIGRRTTSTVASQALMMMNNEFVASQAEKWADRVLAAYPEPGRRVERMFLSAFARPVKNWELERIFSFLDEQATRYGSSEANDRQAWSDLAQVLINSKEFIFVR